MENMTALKPDARRGGCTGSLSSWGKDAWISFARQVSPLDAAAGRQQREDTLPFISFTASLGRRGWSYACTELHLPARGAAEASVIVQESCPVAGSLVITAPAFSTVSHMTTPSRETVQFPCWLQPHRARDSSGRPLPAASALLRVLEALWVSWQASSFPSLGTCKQPHQVILSILIQPPHQVLRLIAPLENGHCQAGLTRVQSSRESRRGGHRCRAWS